MQHRRASVEAVAAAGIALGIDLLYVSILLREGEGDLQRSRVRCCRSADRPAAQTAHRQSRRA